MADPWAVVSTTPAGDPWAVKSVEPAPVADPPPKRSLIQDATGFMANVNRGLGIGDEMAAGGQTIANALGGKIHSIGDVGADFSSNMAHQRELEADYQGAHSNAAPLARGVGNALTVAAPVGPGAAAFANGTRLTNALRGATVAGLTSAGFAAADAGTPEERLKAAADAATPWKNPIGFGLGAAGGALARGAPRRPVQPANPDAAMLEQAGVPLTMGQRAGGLGRRLEDAAESLPLTGSAIKARKSEGIEGFDTVAINEALAPIGQNVAGHGRQAIERANTHISDAYTTALHGVQVAPDAQFQTELAAVMNDPRIPDRVRQDISDAVQEFVVNPLQADQAGVSWKRVDSDLNTLRRAAANAVGTTPQALSLQRALDRVQEAHWGLLERQHPQVADAIASADAANAAMERVRAAAATTGTAARDGLFTPANLNTAVATKGGRAGRRAYGQGTALMQGLSDAGQAVLPSTIPDSGTALRSFIGKLAGQGGLLAGIGAVGGQAAAVPAAIGTIGADLAGAALYSRPVQNALRRSALGRLSGQPAGILAPEVAARISAGAGVGGAQAQAKPALELTVGKSTNPEHLAWRRAHGLPVE